MRRAAFIAGALLLAGLVVFVSYLIFSNSREEAEYSDITVCEAWIENGEFVGRFKCDKEGFYIAGAEFSVENGKLYLTVLLTTYEKKSLEADEDGIYECVYILGDEEVDDCFYRQGGKTDRIILD